MATGIPGTPSPLPLLVAMGLLSTLLTGCAHGPCKTLGALFGCTCVPEQAQPSPQDLSIHLPDLDEVMPGDTNLDGYTLHAIRIAADDFLNPDSTDLPCKAKQVSHGYQARRVGDIIFIRIHFKPENCGRKFGMLDSGATYAISVDGRILRRAIDGMEPYNPPTPSETGSVPAESQPPHDQ